jgi:hypothetical protein
MSQETAQNMELSVQVRIKTYTALQKLQLSQTKTLLAQFLSIANRIQTINPLTPELNSSAQGCLRRFFTGDFNF